MITEFSLLLFKSSAEQVIAKLRGFDIVTLVEELNDTAPAMLNSTLGWREFPEAQKNKQKERETFSDEDVTFITESTRMDRLVYDYFKHVPLSERGR